MRTIIFIVIASGLVGLLPANSAGALAVSDGCRPIESIFVPGSGQPVGKDSDEDEAFGRMINKYLSYTGKPLDYFHHYRLGTEYQGTSEPKYRYPAVSVTDTLTVPAGAWISGGEKNKYGWSVDNGVKELELYMKNRFARGSLGDCTEGRIILGGFSQGAQVVGEYLNTDKIPAQIRQRIDYVALFADPKLHLFEGETPFFATHPPACRSFFGTATNGSGSPWREGVPNCRTHSGSLGARKPYAPDDFAWQLRVGLWCKHKDAVCDSNFPILPPPAVHGTYANDYTEEGVQKALFMVGRKLSSKTESDKLFYSLRNDGNLEDYSDDPWRIIPKTSRYEDARMTEYPPRIPETCRSHLLIDEVRPFTVDYYDDEPYRRALDDNAENAAWQLDSLYFFNCEVGVVKCSSEKPGEMELLLEPTQDYDKLYRTIANIKPVPRSYKAGSYDTTALRAAEIALNSYSWEGYDVRSIGIFTTHLNRRDGGPFSTEVYDKKVRQIAMAKKVQITMRPHDSGCFDSFYRPGTIYLDSLGSVQPAVLYCPSIIELDKPMGAAKVRDKPRNSTAGKVSPAGEDDGVIDEVEEKNEFAVKFPIDRYEARPGETVKFGVVPTNPTVTEYDYDYYEWDVVGDNRFDEITYEPTLEHTYAANFSGQITVKATPRYGAETSATTNATIATEAQPGVARPATPTGLTFTKLSDSSLRLEWKPADALARYWAVRINDTPPFYLDLGQRTTIELRDIEFDSLQCIGVAGITSDGYLGEYAQYDYKQPSASEPPRQAATPTSTSQPPSPGRGATASANRTAAAVATSTTPSESTNEEVSQTTTRNKSQNSPLENHAATAEKISRPSNILQIAGIVVAILTALAATGMVIYKARRKSA